MALTDLDGLLEPVSAEAPCGTDLEMTGDADFLELGRLGQGKPEQQIGNTIIPASDPDWKQLQKKAVELLRRSKDLRPAVELARSLVRTDGWPGFAKGLEIVRGLVERYWEGLFPLLDPEDDNDPQMRLSILRELIAQPQMLALRRTPIVASKTLGKFSLKDVEIANNESPPDKGVPAPSMASIDGAARDTDLDALDQSASAVKACLAHLAGLQAALTDKIDAGEAVSVCGPLNILVKKADAFLAPRLAQRKPMPVVVVEEEVPVAESDGKPAAPAPRQGGGLGGSISSREEVVKAIDLIMAYYARYEPSNPVPLLMARCKRLVMMSFVDIVKELVPEVLKQVEALKGQGE
jgi:type VI secretion system protein ImpA